MLSFLAPPFEEKGVHQPPRAASCAPKRGEPQTGAFAASPEPFVVHSMADPPPPAFPSPVSAAANAASPMTPASPTSQALSPGRPGSPPTAVACGLAERQPLSFATPTDAFSDRQPADAVDASALPSPLSGADVFLRTESYASFSAAQPEPLATDDASSLRDSRERVADLWGASKPPPSGVELVASLPEPEDPEASATAPLRSGASQLALAVTSASVGLSPAGHWQFLDAYGYLVFWFCLNVTITLYIKVIFSQFDFPYPMLMTATHMLFTFLGVSACQVAGAFMPKDISSRALRSLFLFSIIFTMNILLSNASLLAVSINLHQVTRSLVPLCTMFISYLFWNERHPRAVLAPVLVVILGVSLTVWGEMHFSWLELAIVLVGCFFASLKGVLTQKTQMGSLGLSSLDLLRWLCPVAVAQLLSLSYALGEFQAVWDRGTITPRLVAHMTLLGIVAFFINYTSFRCAARHAPLTLNIIGNVKQVITCALSLYVVGGVWTVPLAFGILITALGAYWYALVMARHPKARPNDVDHSRALQTGNAATGPTTTSLESQCALFPNPHIHHPQLRLPSLDLEGASAEIENAHKQQR